jgi:hypothetical protein
MSIEELCIKWHIENYTINDDGSVDVDGEVNLDSSDLTKLPLKFGTVTGDFGCHDNLLTSLEGCPKYVGGNFYCPKNKLTSLKGGPEKVDGHFQCYDNFLTNLKGSPEELYSFDCRGNLLTSLEGGPKSVTRWYSCSDNKLTSLKGGPKSVGTEYDMRSNQLKEIDFIPDFVGEDILTYNNPIGCIFGNVDIEFLKAFNSFKVLKEGVVNLKRLKYVMEIFDMFVDLVEIKKCYKIK